MRTYYTTNARGHSLNAIVIVRALHKQAALVKILHALRSSGLDQGTHPLDVKELHETEDNDAVVLDYGCLHYGT